MSLLRISDLNKSPAELDVYLKEAQKLQGIYLSHIANTQERDTAYDVEIRGASTRGAGIHASEISHCMRVIVYSLMGIDRKPSAQDTDVNMLMRFKLGHAVHAMIQSDWHAIAALSNGRIRFEDELRINPEVSEVAREWNIHSSCDGVITLCDEQLNPWMRVGLEIKTESDGQYSKLSAPRPKHIEQTTVYMATLDLPLMWTLYYNKSSSNFTPSCAPWLFKFNGTLWENELEVRFAKARHHAEVNSLPPRTEGMECRWCPYAYTCKPAILNPTPRISKGMLVK